MMESDGWRPEGCSNEHNIHDCLLMGDVRPYHHACASQQWCHHLTVSVTASGEHLECSQ